MNKKPTKLLNKNFILLWQGQLVSSIGSQIAIIALALWIKTNIDSATVLGISMMVHSLVITFLSPFAGTLADNVSRKKIIVFCDLFAGIFTIALSVMLFMQGTNPVIMVTIIILYNFLMGISVSMLNPSMMAIIPDLVPPTTLSKANSMVSTAVQFAMVGGQAIGGVLFNMFGAPLLMLFDGITYLFSSFSELFISLPAEDSRESEEKSVNQNEEEPKEKERVTVKKFINDLKIGFIHVYREKGVRNSVLGFSLINFLLAPFIVLLPFYVEDTLQLPSFWYGALLALFSVGMFLGIISASFVKFNANIRGVVIGVIMLKFTALTGSLAILKHIALVTAVFVLAGAIIGYFNIIIQTILQGVTPKNLRGRVFGLISTISGGLMPLGMGLTGIVADLLNKNVPLIFTISSSVLFIASILIFFNKHSFDFFAYEPPAEIATSSSTED